MRLSEALEATEAVNIGVEARSVRRKDRRGRTWYLISARGKLFLVRQDKSGFQEVTYQFASKWDDWAPQTSEEASRETALMNTPNGRRFRNTMLGKIMGPLPEGMSVPESLPENL